MERSPRGLRSTRRRTEVRAPACILRDPMSDSDPPVEETVLQKYAFEPVFRSGAWLEWTDRDGFHSVVVDARTLIGSAPGVGIVINDPAVSRLHVEVELRGDGLWARDLGSRNGTFLEGIQIAGAKVPQGGRLRIGGTDITIVYREERRPVEMWPESRFGRLIGGSAPMRELFATLSRVAPMDAAVLIHGETGTGKELIARAIHDASARAAKPFVVVDCAALPENLLDAELFGHTKGAFTGAIGSRAGAVEVADGGTVFLDEIGDLPLAMQPKLLRVLESRTVRRVGEAIHRPVDVRFVSATHRDLLTMVNAGEFREDLYFRLAVLPVTVPPLRNRREDIEALVHEFWAEGGGSGRVSPDMMRELSSRTWRGNVRELRNFVERARALGAAEALALTPTSPTERGSDAPTGSSPAGDRSSARMIAAAPAALPPPPAHEKPGLFLQSFKDFREAWIDEGEREYLRRLLVRHQRNVAAAAKEAEVDRTYVYRLIRKHDL